MTTKNILLIHNESNTEEIIQMFLTYGTDWNVQLTNSFFDGLEQAKLNHPDAIVLDVCLTENDVLWFAKQLRNLPQTEKISIVLLSLRPKWFDFKQFEQYQVTIVIVNPFDLSRLPVEIAHVLGWNPPD
ncbi:response regulator [Capilliphycus salinus ALCB114379]|uniref:response regulator n=1 Tax=Capilliphycus salinus TaxID=2768948 RepID=UPI0039A4056E